MFRSLSPSQYPQSAGGNGEFLLWTGIVSDGQWMGADWAARNSTFGHAATMPCGHVKMFAFRKMPLPVEQLCAHFSAFKRRPGPLENLDNKAR
jgi:hypothetical protein